LGREASRKILRVLYNLYFKLCLYSEMKYDTKGNPDGKG
jgi:hypothetical protein